jgi:hypothetical protein
MDHDLYEADGIRVTWDELGEGLSGEYDEDDLNDVELLRFSVALHVSRFVPDAGDDAPDEDGWWTRQDSSFCTQVPVSATPEQRQALLRLIHAAAGPHDMSATSWISLDSLQKA